MKTKIKFISLFAFLITSSLFAGNSKSQCGTDDKASPCGLTLAKDLSSADLLSSPPKKPPRVRKSGKLEKVTGKTRKTTKKNIFCIEDVRFCPDGSAVPRVPPTCDFMPCSK